MSNLISSDIYRIHEFLNEVKEKHIPVEDSNTLMLGIFGYLGDVWANQIQNSIILSSEWMNEIFPIRARLEKNLLTHAMMAGITDLTAIPSRMDFLIGIREKDLLANLHNDMLLIDKDTSINIGSFEFHLEYDIKIYRQKASNKKDLYIAQYDIIGVNNKLSSITNPYLLPPVKTKLNNEDFIFIRARARQVEFSEHYKKIISNDPIENKTFEFAFENQLADFTVIVNDNKGNVIELESLYDDSSIIDESKKYCYYSYINSNTIRVRFINKSYIPKINDEITVKIITTKGSRGNFTYKDDIIIEPKSKKRVYNNLLLLARPVTDSMFGEDKKSIDDLKRIIPKELLSRGSITCTKDLDNFFNVLNDRQNRLVFLKKIDNQFERVYYSYLLLKDNNDNIIPTNTINLKLNESDFDIINSDRFILRPGGALQYNKDIDRCVKVSTAGFTSDKIKEYEYDGFLYSSPFTTVVNRSPLLVSHYLTIFDRKYNLLFKYINDSSYIQFISTKVAWSRELYKDKDYYKMDMEFTQNIDEDLKLVETDDYGFISSSKIKAIAVVYNKDNVPVRYTEAIPIHYNKQDKTYKFRFKIQTNDNITRKSEIVLNNLFDLNTTNTMDVYVPGNGTKIAIHIIADLGLSFNNNGELNSIVPNIQNYTLCNSYEVENGVDFFINFSDILSSKVTVHRDTPTSPFYFKLDSIPVVRYSYLSISDQVRYLINYIMDKKVFIDTAISVLENSFGIDFKFFNTYGPSRVYDIGHANTTLDRVNLSMTFRLKFVTNTNVDSFVRLVKKEIKKYIEDINTISDIHISNIILHLKNTFNFISYIEFLNINEYDTEYQSILQNIEDKKIYVPEFINIGSKEIVYEPDINIIVI